MKYTDVRAALYTRLQAFPTLPSVLDWENVRSDKPGLSTYIREALKPVAAQAVSIGPKARIRDQGMWLLDVFAPSNEGPKVGDDMADGLREWFYPGLALATPSGLTVIVRQATRFPTIQKGDWRQVPIAIRWFVDSFNTQ